jgi:hypothetical protein
MTLVPLAALANGGTRQRRAARSAEKVVSADIENTLCLRIFVIDNLLFFFKKDGTAMNG